MNYELITYSSCCAQKVSGSDVTEKVFVMKENTRTQGDLEADREQKLLNRSVYSEVHIPREVKSVEYSMFLLGFDGVLCVFVSSPISIISRILLTFSHDSSRLLSCCLRIFADPSILHTRKRF